MTVLVVGQHPGVLVSSKGGRFGVTPASLPTGGAFPSPLANDDPAGGWVAGDEIAWRLDTVAAGGTVSATDQGDWSRTGAADGTYFSTYTRWVARADGTVDKASFTITDTIGSSSSIGVATETSTAFSLAASQAKAIGIATETSAAFALTLTSGASVPVGAATETSSAFALIPSQSKQIGMAVETSTAIARTIAGVVWPNESDVRAGISYGPTGSEYTGTMAGGGSLIVTDITTGRRVKLIAMSL